MFLENLDWVLSDKAKLGDVWLDKEESSADSSSSKIKIEVCLMEKEEYGSNQVSTSSSNKCESYFQLPYAFKEIMTKLKD